MFFSFLLNSVIIVTKAFYSLFKKDINFDMHEKEKRTLDKEVYTECCKSPYKRTLYHETFKTHSFFTFVKNFHRKRRTGSRPSEAEGEVNADSQKGSSVEVLTNIKVKSINFETINLIKI